MTKFHTEFRRYFYVDVVSEGSPTDDGEAAEDVAYDAAYKKITSARFWIQSDIDTDMNITIDGPYVDEEFEPETSEVEE